MKKQVHENLQNKRYNRLVSISFDEFKDSPLRFLSPSSWINGDDAARNKSTYAVLTNILNLLEAHKCGTVIKQYPVQDPDYSAEYLSYYAKCFSSIDKYCTRAHFFSTRIEQNETVLDFLDKAHTNKTSYLGFLTLRPVNPQSIGATFLRPPNAIFYLLSQDTFDIHLAGKTFSLNCTPFIQQDSAVGTCAQASIWMALRTLRKKDGHSAHDPAQITTAATRFLVTSRSLPNRDIGLKIEQIVEAIRSTGYAPHTINLVTQDNGSQIKSKLDDAKKKIYCYIESGIPVILAMYPDTSNNGHALVAIGHGLPVTVQKRKFLPQALNNILSSEPEPLAVILGNNHKLQVYNASIFIKEFIVHNDNMGPYCRLPVESDEPLSLKNCKYAVPLLPGDVFMNGEEAESVALEVLNQLLPPIFDQSSTKPDALILRIYLTDRSAFRTWAAENNLLNNDLKTLYRQKELPKRLWIAELSIKSSYINVNNGDVSRIGEMLIDPTGDPNDIISAILLFHINLNHIQSNNLNNGLVWDKEFSDNKIKFYYLEDDSTYDITRRKCNN